MTELSTTIPAAEPTTGAARDAFDRLSPLGWSGGLAAIVAALLLSFLLFGYFLIYWRNADMDFMITYSALAMNDGKPQHFLDHTAYLTILTVKSWFQLLHSMGFLDAYTLPAIPPATNASAFDAAMTGAVRAGRVLMFLIATGCVLIFAGLSRLILRDWRIALLAALAFAASGGIAVHSRILRSELVAACPVIFALMILIFVARRGSLWRPLLIALAAGLCVIGLENKVQAILLIGTLPIVILPFGSDQSRGVAFWSSPASGLAVLIAAIAAALASWAAWPLVSLGLNQGLLRAAAFHPLLLDCFGIYQGVLMVLIFGCMITFAAIWRVSIAETVASMLALIAGGAAALLLLNVAFNAADVIAVFNPLEKMLTFADASTSNVANGSNPLAVLLLLLEGLASVLARYTFVLHSSPRPTVFLTWLIFPGIVYAWRQGKKQVALQSLLLMGAAIGIDAITVRRGLKIEYFIFTDPLIILAGAILLDSMRSLRFHKWAYPIAVSLIALHIAVGQAEPIKYAFKRTGPASICEWSPYYMPLMRLPWCPARS
jgi:hypothetical protein